MAIMFHHLKFGSTDKTLSILSMLFWNYLKKLTQINLYYSTSINAIQKCIMKLDGVMVYTKNFEVTNIPWALKRFKK